MTDTSRRTLLRAGALGALVSPLLPVGAAFAARPSDPYVRSRFDRLVGATFTLVAHDDTWSVTLLRVGDLPGAPPGDDHRFGLTLSSPAAGPPQGSHTLQRRGFTPTTLFVVPSDPERRTYEAVVNRL